MKEFLDLFAHVPCDAYHFKHFFDDPKQFRVLEPFYDKTQHMFRMATAGERNNVMKDMVWVEQAMAMGAVVF